MKVFIALSLAGLGLCACQPAATPQPDAAAASSVSASALSADAQGLGPPEAFLKALYANYASKGDRFDPAMFTPLHERAADIFEPDLAAVMRDNDRMSAGYGDLVLFDPLCDCSGHDPMTADIALDSVTATTAKAVVHLKTTSKFSNYDRVIRLQLVRTNGVWRIHDTDSAFRRDVTQAHDILLVAPATSGPPPAQTPGTTQVKAMLQAIYTHYAPNEDETWHPTWSETRATYFDPDMLALMQEDDKLADGEVGALDADPFCGCQDIVNFKATVTAVQLSPARIVATVLLTQAKPQKDSDGKLMDTASKTYFDLRLTRKGWRIHDIAQPGMPSMHQTFIDSNKRLSDYAASASASASS